VFDVGFSEVLLIAVVALLVVGPREFPTLVRNVGSWLGRARQFMNAVKTEFDKEIHKADEIKRLMAKEVEIAERHKTLDLDRRADRPPEPPAKPLPREDRPQPDLFQGDNPPPTIATETAKPDHGPAQS
jgi:sec-independent protein translocase protein TatB